MSEIEVRELKKDEYKLWNDLVESSPHGTIFHNSDWLTTCSELLNKRLKIYGCFENEELVGGCSLYIYKLKRFFKTASSIIEMTPYGGVVLSQSPSSKVREQEQTYSNIIKLLCNAFDNEHFDHIQITNSPDFVDIRPFTWNGWDSKIHYTYYFNLENDVEKNISKNVRWSIRKAIKNNITIKKLNNPSTYYELFSMTFKRQSLKPPITKEFLEKMIDILKTKNTGEMWIAETSSGEVASAEIVIWDNKRAYRWSAASHTNFKDTGATSLLLYEIFQDLKNRGFKEINLMAANTPHLTKFISSFNPRLVPYYSIEKKRLFAISCG
jgi:lipid II:glycine glycyltransferase (peptidoglycan interpeptide bridge formation enzyme)